MMSIASFKGPTRAPIDQPCPNDAPHVLCRAPLKLATKRIHYGHGTEFLTVLQIFAA
jgi:hypothetical protein